MEYPHRHQHWYLNSQESRRDSRRKMCIRDRCSDANKLRYRESGSLFPSAIAAGVDAMHAAKLQGYTGANASRPAVRTHFAELKSAGIGLGIVSRLTGLSQSYLDGIKTASYRANIRADFAAAILSWTPEICLAERKVRAKSARLHLQSLVERP